MFDNNPQMMFDITPPKMHHQQFNYNNEQVVLVQQFTYAFELHNSTCNTMHKRKQTQKDTVKWLPSWTEEQCSTTTSIKECFDEIKSD